MAPDDSVTLERSQLTLRRELYSLLCWHMHHSDRSPRDTLNRLVMKGCGVTIKKASIRIREQFLTLTDLAAIRQDTHDGDTPHTELAPIILFVNNAGEYVLDGQKRINLWLKSGSSARRRCLLVSLKGRKNVL